MNTVFFKELRQGITHLFYPRLCEGCRRPLLAAEQVICIGCALYMPETAYHAMEDNETALRFAGRVPFAHATSFAYFTNDGLLQHLMHGLKYRNRQETGVWLGQQFARAIMNTSWIREIDIILPVPLHPAKKARRGYNQSMLIAEGMARILNIPASDKILLRVKDTESQTHKTRSERVNNMAEAFKVSEKAQLAGKHILLCDDVLTTGATLEACALALMAEESIKISIATIGIAIS